MVRRPLCSVRHRTSKPPSYVLHVIPFLRYYYDDENAEANDNSDDDDVADE